MKITKHFSVEEFRCRDGTDYPECWINSRLKPLCKLLEQIRALFDVPVNIVSGYRTESYNRKIGGVGRSQHIQGRAADIVIERISARQVQFTILTFMDLAPIKGFGKYPNFTHIDTRSGRRAHWSGGKG